jgi:hypothetical protein
MGQEQLPTAEPWEWPDEATSRIRHVWKLSPPIPDVSGCDLARAFTQCGFEVVESTDAEWRLEGDGRALNIPRRDHLPFDVVAALAITANVGPLTLVSAIEKTILRPTPMTKPSGRT